MIGQSEVWLIMNDDDLTDVWAKFYQEFDFSPSTKLNSIPFKFRMPVDIYDISTSLIWQDDEKANEMIRLTFVECMKDDAYIYALDWQHTCFKYNPRIIDHFKYPLFIDMMYQ